MERPFFNSSIEMLEAELNQQAGNHVGLETLLAELSHRSTERAKKLRSRVEAALGHASQRALTAERTIESKTNSVEHPNTAVIEDDKNRIKARVESEKRSTLTNYASDILSAWTALEVLTPQAFRPPEKHLDRKSVV